MNIHIHAYAHTNARTSRPGHLVTFPATLYSVTTIHSYVFIYCWYFFLTLVFHTHTLIHKQTEDTLDFLVYVQRCSLHTQMLLLDREAKSESDFYVFGYEIL